MANISGQMDNVFDDGLDFDVIFDDEDRLIDTVAGVKEDGTPVLGDEYANFFDENGEFIGESDVSIPGETNTDDGKLEDKAGEADLLARTTDDHNDTKDQKLNRDAESDGTAAAPNSSEAQVDDEESASEFRKDLGYTKEDADLSAPGEPDTDDGENEESANNKAAEETMKNGQNEQKPDDNTSVGESVDELLDESLEMDLELTDESVLTPIRTGLDAELIDEALMEEADVEDDPEEDFIDTVDANDASAPDLDYDPDEDDLLIDELLN